MPSEFNRSITYRPLNNCFEVREGTFLIGGGGGGGPKLRRGGSLVNILQIGEGQTYFIRNLGRVAVVFDKEKITPCRLVDSYLLTSMRGV